MIREEINLLNEDLVINILNKLKKIVQDDVKRRELERINKSIADKTKKLADEEAVIKKLLARTATDVELRAAIERLSK